MCTVSFVTTPFKVHRYGIGLGYSFPFVIKLVSELLVCFSINTLTCFLGEELFSTYVFKKYVDYIPV